MKMLIALTIALLFQHSSSLAPPPPPDTKTVYDHLQFVQTWTPTFCSPASRSVCVSPLPEFYTNNFSMHGLWPANIYGDSLRVPKTKPSRPISDEVFEKLERELDTYWAVIDTQWQPKQEFWDNEWIKHGQMGLWGDGDAAGEAYLQQGIKARQGMNLLQILVNGGLSLGKLYSKQDIVNAVHSQLRVENVYISCQQGHLLFEILICLHKTTHQPITCPPNHSLRGCTGSLLKLPVFQAF